MLALVFAEASALVTPTTPLVMQHSPAVIRSAVNIGSLGRTDDDATGIFPGSVLIADGEKISPAKAKIEAAKAAAAAKAAQGGYKAPESQTISLGINIVRQHVSTPQRSGLPSLRSRPCLLCSR